MGSDNGGDDERPAHSVTLSPFSMAKYEVTYAQWIEVKDWGESHGYTFNMPGDMGSEDYSETQDENHPVTCIEWYDTVLWCNALSEMEGRTPCYYTSASQSTVYRSGRINIKSDWVKWEADGYRLPTEAEWEYVCRAETTTYSSFGSSIDGSDANYRYSGDSYDNGTTPVGSYAANAWGLYDMHGNVWEWCWDWHDSSYYNSSPSTDPRGPLMGLARVVRSGGWGSRWVHLSSANRGFNDPDHSDYDLGFRPVSSQ
ncbi:MAG: formylglycine-generating enzyme family protein [Chloroflexi bacterium]|nr:formylglycine-generating enzyme family protein [Chloroflexota bacterium]